MYAQHKISIAICMSIATVAPISSVVEIQQLRNTSVKNIFKVPPAKVFYSPSYTHQSLSEYFIYFVIAFPDAYMLQVLQLVKA